MTAQTTNNKQTIRRLIIFVVGINLLGWLGWLIAQEGTADAQGLGMLIWLGSPLLLAILLRLFGKDSPRYSRASSCSHRVCRSR